MKWNEIVEEYKFDDNSIVTQRHETHNIFCYRFWLKKHPKNTKDNSITISEDHYVLCDVSKVNERFLEYLEQIQSTQIPVECDYHFSLDKDKNIHGEDEVIKYDNWIVNEKERWLSGKSIFTLLMNKQKVNPVGNKFSKWEATGEKECFCISTNTGKYECCGVINHNSVALRNIIFHSLTHGDDITLGLVDLKLSEFEKYKGMNNIVGVANTKLEATELLRMAREVMYKRNKENAERGLTDFADYKPTKPMPIVKIFGREFPEDHEFKVKIGDEEKTMTATEILKYMGKE